MKCTKCGKEAASSARICSRCGEALPQEFNYKNMERELLNTVWEEETIQGIAGGSVLYGQPAALQTAADKEQKGMRTIGKQNLSDGIADIEEMDDDEIPQKQPVKLTLAVLASAAVFGGLAFFLHNFPTGYNYEKKETEYLNCLNQMAKEDYSSALDAVSLLLKEEPDSLEYLALKNIICEKSEDNKLQKETLKKIISLDADNYQAYEKLLALYLEAENQEGIEKLAADAPNSAIAAMLSEYLVDTPYLELTPGVYDASQTLVITSEAGNDIYYTLDGTSPQKKGVLYSAPVPLEQNYIYSVRAVCKNERGAYGDETAGEYQIGIDAVNRVTSTANPSGTEITDGSIQSSGTDGSAQPAQPAVYPQSGTYTTQQRITIDVPIGYQAYYSWAAADALTPQNGTLYTGGITMPEGSSVLSVIVTDANGNSSAVKQVSYTYQP